MLGKERASPLNLPLITELNVEMKKLQDEMKNQRNTPAIPLTKTTEIKGIVDQVVSDKIQNLIHELKLYISETTQKAVNMSLIPELTRIRNISDQISASINTESTRISSVEDKLDDLMKKIEDQGTRFTVKEFDTFAERERQNLKMVVEYANIMQSRFTNIGSAPSLPQQHYPSMHFHHQSSQPWLAERGDISSIYADRPPHHHPQTTSLSLPPPPPQMSMDIVQRYEEQSKGAKAILEFRSPTKPDQPRAEGNPIESVSYSQFLEWQREHSSSGK